MKHSVTCAGLVAAGLLFSGGASAERGPGWEFGADVLYQLDDGIDFDGGARVSLDDAFGFSFGAGYRFNSRLELQMALDWQDTDYDVTTPATVIGTLRYSNSLEAITPRVNLNYNFTDGPVTPYVTGGIAYSFIDTNIPQGRPSTVCWWDPWWGYVCGDFQDTKSLDEFAYQLGVGLRWDVGPGYTVRLAYEKRWVDVGQARGTPSMDQFRVGLAYRF